MSFAAGSPISVKESGEQRKMSYQELICPFMGCYCKGYKCELFMVRKWVVEMGRVPWMGCALRALPLVLKGEI